MGWIRRRKALAYALFGLTAGLMAGTVNVMVPILIILVLELGISATAMVVLFNLNFLSGKLTQTCVFLASGAITPATLTPTLILIPAALAALFAGIQLRRHIDEARYRRILRGILWFMVGVLVMRYFSTPA